MVARYRAKGETVALVPTMGALHDGHLSLVRAAHKRAKRVIVSIFVNPAQFAPSEDFKTYPRTINTDAAMLAKLKVDAIWAPTV
ncbi:MAG TPA: pantoate--beta-alanine ligase, partial [Vicinamibacterales bacterium]